jgi:hypothetical protein
MDEFEPGESVLLVDSPEHARGWVVGQSEDGRQIQVRWVRRAGYEAQVTSEPVDTLRRMHESDDDML